jgi:glycosyltransferase involved in cell wall biosynthesis
MRVKILDAWARGVPIVSTSIGAEGIRYLDGENILIADEPSDFAAATLKLIQNRPMAFQLAQAGRQWVAEHYDWRTIYRAWDDIYRDKFSPSATR